MNPLYIHDLYNLFCFKGPNQLYVILKKFKVSEFLHVMTFDTLGIFSFDTKSYTIPWKHPKVILYKKRNFVLFL